MVLSRRQTQCSNENIPIYLTQSYPYSCESGLPTQSLNLSHSNKRKSSVSVMYCLQLIVLIIVSFIAWKKNSQLNDAVSDLTIMNDELLSQLQTLHSLEEEVDEAQSMFSSVKEKMKSIFPLREIEGIIVDSADARKNLMTSFMAAFDVQSFTINSLRNNIRSEHHNDLLTR